MSYTQAPHLTGEEIESLLKGANVARICSFNPDGTIHAVPVNFKYETGRIIIATPAASRKARNVKRNGNVTILVDVGGNRLSDFKGVIIYGKASLKEPSLSDFLAINETWMPSDLVETSTKRLLELATWVMISIEPIRTASFDYAKDDDFAAAVRG